MVRDVNEFVPGHLPHLSYTSIALVHGAGRAPMKDHTHHRNNCALTGKIIIGDFDGGGTSSPLHGHIWGSESYGDAWSMQEPAPSPMHILCMDYALAWGTLCHCMLNKCTLGTLDARHSTRTP